MKTRRLSHGRHRWRSEESKIAHFPANLAEASRIRSPRLRHIGKPLNLRHNDCSVEAATFSNQGDPRIGSMHELPGVEYNLNEHDDALEEKTEKSPATGRAPRKHL